MSPRRERPARSPEPAPSAPQRRTAGLALLLAAPAAAALVMSGTGGGPAPVRPAQATTTICVGVVVDYGHARPAGGVSTYCARVPAGSTGADVLAVRAKALHRPAPTYRSGLLCTIDGYPRDGSCGVAAPGGGYRYWSYWHRPAGTSTWQYSRAGASLFHVSNNSTEGWSYQDGGTEMGRKPASVSLATICPPTASPTPTRKPSVPTATPRTGGVTHAPAAGSAASTRRSTPSAIRPTSASATQAAAPSSAAAGSPAGTAAGAATGSTSPATSPDPSLTPAGNAAAADSSSGGFPWAAIGGLALVGAVACGAAWRSRRSSRTPPPSVG